MNHAISISNPLTANIRNFIRFIILYGALTIPSTAFCDEFDWSLGVYGGQYYDSMPAGLLAQGNANFLNQYLLAITASKTVWSSKSLPLSLEMDGMIGQQIGMHALGEIGVSPALRWSGFPWSEILHTAIRFAPLGISYSTDVSTLERGKNGQVSRTLNLLLIEFDFSLPQLQSKELFVRLHHRCTIYDMLNDYGANGEDFLAIGYRQFF